MGNTNKDTENSLQTEREYIDENLNCFETECNCFRVQKICGCKTRKSKHLCVRKHHHQVPSVARQPLVELQQPRVLRAKRRAGDGEAHNVAHIRVRLHLGDGDREDAGQRRAGGDRVADQQRAWAQRIQGDR